MFLASTEQYYPTKTQQREQSLKLFTPPGTPYCQFSNISIFIHRFTHPPFHLTNRSTQSSAYKCQYIPNNATVPTNTPTSDRLAIDGDFGGVFAPPLPFPPSPPFPPFPPPFVPPVTGPATSATNNPDTAASTFICSPTPVVLGFTNPPSAQ